VVFNFSQQADGSFKCTMDSPDQAAFSMPADTVILKGDSVFTGMSKLKMKFAGKLLTDSVMDGTFTQMIDIPLKLKKAAKATELVRPQTPKQPFGYSSKEVSYDNADKTVHFGGTYTKPFIAANERSRERKYPAILLITGSGQQNRDEEILGHKPFALMADYLTKLGYIVLRVDDRGMGQTTGELAKATSADFANDVEAGIDFLKSRIDVDTSRIGLLGHSEGGMIAPMVAARRNDISFIILLAGPGIKIIDLMTEQAMANMGTAGISANATKAYGLLYKGVAQSVIAGKDSVSIRKAAAKVMSDWIKKTAPSLVKETGFESVLSREEYLKNMIRTLSIPWFRYFIAYNPQPALQKLKCRVLAINGSKDIQVLPASNLAGIRTCLQKSKSQGYEVKELPGLNHLFQACNRCDVKEYGELEETYSPAMLQVVGDWLKKNIQ
jgi:hypothetical protein